jgi:hypothetical protein
MADDTQTDDTKKDEAPKKDAKFQSFISSLDLPSDKKLESQDEAYAKKLEEVRKPYAEKSNELMEKMSAVNASMKKIGIDDKAPKLEKAPERPDIKEQDPMKAMGSVGSLIAILGSLRTRAPATAALNSAAAAMKAYHQGDMEGYQLERQKWQDQMEKALRNNQEEMQQYMAVLQKNNFDMHKAQAELSTLSAQFQDNNMQSAQAAGDVQAQYTMMKGRLQTQEKYAELFTRHQEKEAQLEATRTAHADAVANRKSAENERAERWIVTQIDHSPELKNYRKNIEMANTIESNLVPGTEMGQEERSMLQKFLTTGRSAKWAQVPEAHGQILERLTKRIEQGIGGKMNDDEIKVTKEFLDNIRASSAAGIDSEKRRYAPLANGKMDPKVYDSFFEEMKRGNAPTVLGGPDLSRQDMDAAAKTLAAAMGR